MYYKFVPLIEKKNWIEAFALAVLLEERDDKLTQKLCGELLCSPTKGKKALEVLKYYKVVGDSWWMNAPDMTLPDMPSTDNEFWELASIICKQVRGNYPSCNNLLNYWVWKNISYEAKVHNLSEEEFITIFIKEIMKDDFWKIILTWETFIRKFDNLYAKFWNKIPKRPAGWLSSVENIF